jgi:DNA (cytosine-5)-methyltransferase 1
VDTRTFNVISLCSGVGGLDLGLRLAIPTARTVCYVEIEAFPIEVLVSRMEDKTMDQAPVWTDCKTFDGNPWSKKVDCVIGGYPCQPFSVAGKQEGTSDPRHLWPHISRIVREVQPEWCFFENVENHLNLGFRDVRDELQAMGYDVEAGIFSAEEVGAPHRRRRLFILAHSFRIRRSGGSEVVRRSEVSRRPSSEVETARPIGELAHASVEGLEGGEWEINQRNRTRLAYESEVLGSFGLKPMADPDSDGRRGGGIQTPRGNDKGRRERGFETQWIGGADLASRGLSSNKVGDMDDADIEGLQRYRDWRGSNQLPPWPPSPQSDAWDTEKPTLEPAICGVVDGVDPWVDGSLYSNRTERLRAVGNGVVPVVAALAFDTLAERLGYEIHR